MKRILITGGSRGIGRALVERLASSSENEIVFSYRSEESKAFELEKKFTGRVRALKLDLLEVESFQEIIKKEIEENGGFDSLVLNAGMAQDSALFFMEEKQWKDVIDVSLNSFFYLTKLCIPHMIEKRSGRIVSLVSISGESGNRGQCNYAAAKGALIAASKSLARELGSRGVLVNAVSPGLIETDMTKDVPRDEIKKMIPLQRVGRPEEVAGVVEFLLSDAASYITGEIIRVNGGLLT